MEFAELASIDGEITPLGDARLPLPDDGLYRGDGVFEVIRLYGGHPFALAEHLDRIARSAGAIELPVERAILEREIAAVVARLGPADGQLRILLTRAGRRIVLSEPLPAWAETISLASVEYSPTIILTGVKSLSYAANMQATRLAKAAGGDEALLVRSDGTVLEAPTSTIFWTDPDGGLVTPSLECGILASITRAKLIEALDVTEGAFALDDVLSAGEAFLASTTREVHGIERIDDREYEAPGPATARARDAFAEIVRRDRGKESAPA
jgi:branched-chain amino acid aminotransferase